MKPGPLIHRDLKSHNLLLTTNYQKLKIGDFGTAADLKTVMTCERGTAAYIAPEVVRFQVFHLKRLLIPHHKHRFSLETSIRRSATFIALA